MAARRQRGRCEVTQRKRRYHGRQDMGDGHALAPLRAVEKRNEISRQHAMQPPYVVKPVAEGSSFGVVIVR